VARVVEFDRLASLGAGKRSVLYSAKQKRQYLCVLRNTTRGKTRILSSTRKSRDSPSILDRRNADRYCCCNYDDS